MINNYFIADGFLVTHCNKLIETFSSDPNNFANALFGEALISEDALDEVRELNITNKRKAGKIHSGLLHAVHTHMHHEKLASIFEERLVCAEMFKELQSYCASELH